MVHADATTNGQGAMISHNNIASYSRMLHNTQNEYTASEAELLSAVSILDKHECVSLAQTATVCANRTRPPQTHGNTERVAHDRIPLPASTALCFHTKQVQETAEKSLQVPDGTTQLIHTHVSTERVAHDK